MDYKLPIAASLLFLAIIGCNQKNQSTGLNRVELDARIVKLMSPVEEVVLQTENDFYVATIRKTTDDLSLIVKIEVNVAVGDDSKYTLSKTTIAIVSIEDDRIYCKVSNETKDESNGVAFRLDVHQVYNKVEKKIDFTITVIDVDDNVVGEEHLELTLELGSG